MGRAEPTIDERPVILFDGVCNLCASAVQFVIARDATARYRFASLQSPAGRRLLEEAGANVPEAPQTVFLVEGGRVFGRSDAGLRIARTLGGIWPMTALFWIVPRPVRDAVYDFIAKRRYRWFGQREACWLPTPELRARFLDIGNSAS